MGFPDQQKSWPVPLSDQGTFTPDGSWGPNRRKPLSQRNFAMKFAPYYKKS